MKEYLTVVAKFKAKAGKEAELRETLLSLVKPTHAEEGCVNYDLHQSTQDPRVFIFHENWTSEGLLDRHLGSDHLMKAAARAASLLEGPMEIHRLKKISAAKV